jgi:hypothetical protein
VPQLQAAAAAAVRPKTEVPKGAVPWAKLRNTYGRKRANAIGHELERLNRQSLTENVPVDPYGSLAIDLAAGGVVGGARALLAKGAAKAVAGTAARETATTAGRRGIISAATRRGAKKEAGSLIQRAKQAAKAPARRAGSTKAAEAARVANRAAARRALAKRNAARRWAEQHPHTTRALKASTLPVRVVGKHPKSSIFTLPVTAEVPGAAVNLDPSQLKKGLEGTGVLASAGSDIGEFAAKSVPSKVAQNAVKDAFNLPAQTLPSVYLPAAAAVEKFVKDDPSRWDKLVKDMGEHDAIVGLAKAALGDEKGLEQAGKGFVEHPLYTALEAQGIKAVAGRSVGAAGRRIPGVRNKPGFSTYREPKVIRGSKNLGDTRKVGRYSPDVINQIFQRAHDRRTAKREGGQYVPRHRQGKVYRQMMDRLSYEGTQRVFLSRHKIDDILKGMLPRKGAGGRLRRLDKDSADTVALAVQRILQSPKTFGRDIATYRRMLEDADDGNLKPTELAANRELRDLLDRAENSADPVKVFASADQIAPFLNELQKVAVEKGLFSPEQVARRAEMPRAIVHEGARYGRPEELVADVPPPARQLLSERGEPISTEELVARRGDVPQPATITQRRATRATARSDFWRDWFSYGRQHPGQKRFTGETTRKGTAANNAEALRRQAHHVNTLIQSANNYDTFASSVGAAMPENITKAAQARELLQEIEQLRADGMSQAEINRVTGLDLPDAPLTVLRRSPYAAKGDQLERIVDEQGLETPGVVSADDLTQNALAENARNIEREATPEELALAAERGDSPFMLAPAEAADRMFKQMQPYGPMEKLLQQGGQMWKMAILPTSPNWYVGNAADNFIRTALAGIGPGSYLKGRRFAKALGKENLQAIVTGAGMESVGRTRVHRDLSQLTAEAGNAEKGLWTAAHVLRNTPGIKQIGDLYRGYANAMVHYNALFTEVLPAYGALGKEVSREFQALTGKQLSALRAMPDAYADLAKRFRDGGYGKNVQYQRAVEEVYGNWGKNSPAFRRFLVDFAPFAMWSRAAVRYVWLTLPAHHPIQQGMIAAAAQMTDEERKKLGLDIYAQNPVRPFQQGALPAGPGTLYGNLPRFTSGGYFGNLWGNIGGQALGPAMGVLQGLMGRDWRGYPVPGLENHPEKILANAVLVGAESFVPFLPQVRSATSGGIGKLSPVRKIEAQRETTSSSSSSSGVDYDKVFEGGSSGGVDYNKVFGGG